MGFTSHTEWGERKGRDLLKIRHVTVDQITDNSKIEKEGLEVFCYSIDIVRRYNQR